MIICILVLSVVCGLASILIQSELLLFTAWTCLAVELALLVSDVTGMLRTVRSLLDTNLPSGTPRLSSVPQSSVGAVFASYFEALEYRLKSRAAETPKIIRSQEHELLSAISHGALTKPPLEPDEAFYQHVLRYCRENFGCVAAAVVISSPKSDVPCTAFISGAGGKRFTAHLIQYLDPTLSNLPGSCGLIDGARSGAVLGDLSSFGYCSSICQSFIHCEDRRRLPAALWLGYSTAAVPSLSDQQSAKDLAQALTTRSASLDAVCELSSRVQKVEHSDRVKSEFIAHLSHDIRSPLNNIKSILAVLKYEGQSADTPEMIDVALANCESAKEIVEDLLDFGKHEAGKLMAHPQDIELNQMVDEVRHIFSVAAQRKGIELKLEDQQTDFYVRADKQQLRRILMNLVSNAIKYTAVGKVELLLSADDSQTVQIAVSDTGEGMTPSQVATLFKPYLRHHGPETDGVGLGLTLTKILCQLNGCTIAVTSIRHQGTKVVLRIPGASARPVAVRRQLASPTNQPKHVQCIPTGAAADCAKKILIVDDDTELTKSLARHFERAGFSVLTATTTEAACGLLNYQSPALLITDSEIPGGGGEQLLRHIERKRLATLGLAITGKIGSADRNRLLSAGALRVFTKPVETRVLLDCVSDLLRDANDNSQQAARQAS